MKITFLKRKEKLALKKRRENIQDKLVITNVNTFEKIITLLFTTFSIEKCIRKFKNLLHVIKVFVKMHPSKLFF